MIRALFFALTLAAMSAIPLSPTPAAAGYVTAEEFSEVAVPFVGKKEGMRLKAYKDIVGVWTICAGHTRTVVPGETRTLAQCEALLRTELLEYREGLHAYLTDETLRTRLTPERDTAYVSLAFNVGIRGAGRSTAVRRLNAGDIRGGCNALTMWNKAGGRVVRGLLIRRKEERDLCLIGL